MWTLCTRGFPSGLAPHCGTQLSGASSPLANLLRSVAGIGSAGAQGRAAVEARAEWLAALGRAGPPQRDGEGPGRRAPARMGARVIHVPILVDLDAFDLSVDAPHNGGTARAVIEIVDAASGALETTGVGAKNVNKCQSVNITVALPQGAYLLLAHTTVEVGHRQSAIGRETRQLRNAILCVRQRRDWAPEAEPAVTLSPLEGWRLWASQRRR